MNIMQRGGNAADAAIAAAMVNVVTKPHRTHLGGDAFFLVWRRGPNTVDCLNAGGRAPHHATLERFAGGIPTTGPLASTVPGFVDGMQELYVGYATLPLKTLLEPAIKLAEDGFPVSLRFSRATSVLPRQPELANEAFMKAFLKNGREPYEAGETLRQPELAETLHRIADEERDGFYAGKTAELIAKAYRDAGGIIDEEDLERQQAHWHDPLVTTYNGCNVYEQALPSQGIILVEALNIVENFPLREWGLNSPNAVHVMAEATKMAFADSRRYSADPEVEAVPWERMTSKEFARARAAQIDLKRAQDPGPMPISGDTTQFVVGDGDMAITLIQSVFSAWGARFLIPGTGILMNNRLRGFNVDPASPNRLEPGKRTVHTLNTFLAVRDGALVVGGGTPGADFQVQANLQTMTSVVDFDLDLQSAVDAPRWVSTGGKLAMESRFPQSLIDDLGYRGHEVQVTDAWDGTVSRSQAIASLPEGGWAVASDLRGEGTALGS